MSARRWSLDTLLSPGVRLGIDSNILMYLLDGSGPRADAAAAITDAIEAGSVEGVFASVGLAEVLVGYARTGDAARFEVAADELRSLGLRIGVLDAAIAEDAAWLRGTIGLGLEDAVHLATARSAGASHFVTNDRRIRSVSRLEVVYLDDLLVA